MKFGFVLFRKKCAEKGKQKNVHLFDIFESMKAGAEVEAGAAATLACVARKKSVKNYNRKQQN